MNETMHVLYVDDEQINRLIFEKLMGKKCAVITAENGQEALSFLKENPQITHVISDMKMPQMTGLEFIQLAKKQFSKLRYYILTGYMIDEALQHAKNEGLILECWTKPAQFDVIFERLQKEA